MEPAETYVGGPSTPLLSSAPIHGAAHVGTQDYSPHWGDPPAGRGIFSAAAYEVREGLKPLEEPDQ